MIPVARASAPASGTISTTPASLSSRTPSTGVLITGVPAARASSTTKGSPSESEDTTTRSARAANAGASCRRPVKVSRPSSPSVRACSVSSARRGPSPTTTKRTSGRSCATRAAATTKRAWFFCATRRPRIATTGAPPSPNSPSSAATALGSAGGTTTLLSTTCTPAAGSPAARSPAATSSETHVTASVPRNSAAALRYSVRRPPW